jgi:hypothetical protein
MLPKSQSRPPRWYAIPVRVLLLTFLGALLVFAVSLFLGIMGTMTLAMAKHGHPDMRMAYRQVALPAAVVAGGILFILSSAMEIRHYRQAKTLAAIARVS